MLRSNFPCALREALHLASSQERQVSFPGNNPHRAAVTTPRRTVPWVLIALVVTFLSGSVPLFGVTPTIGSITPSSAYRGQSVNVTFFGSNLATTTAVNGWGSNVTVSKLSATDTAVTATFTLNNKATVGTHNLSLATAYGNTNAVRFQVLGPLVSSLTPTSASQGQSVKVTFSGTNLSTTTGVSGWGTNAAVSNLSATASTVTATFNVSSQATLQTYSLKLLTSMGYSNKVSFQVTAGSVPTLSVSPGSLNFGNDPVGTADTLPVTLSSTGTAAVTVSAGTISGTGFSMSGATFPVTVNPGVAITMQVKFDPATAGADTGAITLSSNSSSGSTTIVGLSGTGTHWVGLTWTAPANSPVPVTGYNVYRAPSGSSSFQLLNSSPITQGSYADFTVQSGSSYTYYVESIGSSGSTSVPSTQLTLSIP